MKRRSMLTGGDASSSNSKSASRRRAAAASASSSSAPAEAPNCIALPRPSHSTHTCGALRPHKQQHEQGDRPDSVAPNTALTYSAAQSRPPISLPPRTPAAAATEYVYLLPSLYFCRHFKLLILLLPAFKLRHYVCTYLLSGPTNFKNGLLLCSLLRTLVIVYEQETHWILLIDKILLKMYDVRGEV